VSGRNFNTRLNNNEIYGVNVRRRKNTYRYLMSSNNIDGIVTWRDTSEILYQVFFAKSRRRKIVVKRKMYKDLVALNKLPSLKRDCCTFFFVSPLTWREKPRMKGWKFLGGIEKEISAGKISNLTDVMICMRANKAIVPFLRRWIESTFSTIVKTYQHQN